MDKIFPRKFGHQDPYSPISVNLIVPNTARGAHCFKEQRQDLTFPSYGHKLEKI